MPLPSQSLAKISRSHRAACHTPTAASSTQLESPGCRHLVLLQSALNRPPPSSPTAAHAAQPPSWLPRNGKMAWSRSRRLPI